MDSSTIIQCVLIGSLAFFASHILKELFTYIYRRADFEYKLKQFKNEALKLIGEAKMQSNHIRYEEQARLIKRNEERITEESSHVLDHERRLQEHANIISDHTDRLLRIEKVSKDWDR